MILPFDGPAVETLEHSDLHWEISHQLSSSQADGLQVIAQTTYQEIHPPEQMAQELGADFLVEGTLRRDGEDVQVRFQMVRLPKQVVHLSQSFQIKASKSASRLIATQIADSIREALKLSGTAP